jgi:hypothetical protein
MQQAANEVFCGARRILRRLILEPPFFPGNLWVVRFLSSPLVKPWFPQGFWHFGEVPLAFLPIHACPCLQVLRRLVRCLGPRKRFSESS